MYSHFQRDISSEVAGVKNTFSGWDQCMTKAYCKWPVIIGIVVGVVMALSIIWCLVRCLCCGVECCCSCISCFSCCTSCCRGTRNRKRGYSQTAPFPPVAQYQSPPAPIYAQMHTPPVQYARFDAPSNRSYNEDALPPMPSWENSRTTYEKNDVEMGRNGEHYSGDIGMTAPHSSYGYGGLERKPMQGGWRDV